MSGQRGTASSAHHIGFPRPRKDTSRIIIRLDQENFAGKREISPLYTPKEKKTCKSRENLCGQESRVYVFERLSRDLRPTFYALDVARDAPGDSSQPYNRSI